MNSFCIPCLPQCLQVTSDSLKFLDTIHEDGDCCVVCILHNNPSRHGTQS